MLVGMKNADQNLTQTQSLETTPAENQSSQPAARRISRRSALLGGLGVLGVTSLGGAAWGYNRYLRDHTEIADVAAYEAQAASNSTTSAATAAANDTALTNMQVTATGATADNGSITLNTIVLNEGTSDQITAYTAEVKLGSASILRSAFANNQFGLNIVQNPSEMAAAHNAIWAINGDYYGFRETGIVIRNGVVYRDAPARTGLAFYADGTAKIYDETTTDAQPSSQKASCRPSPSARPWSKTAQSLPVSKT